MKSRYAPDTTGATPTWHRRAACAQLADPEIMFPGSDPAAIEAARTVCTGCPVQRACLRDVITEEGAKRVEYRHGIRAGLTERERLSVYRTLKRRGQIT